MLIQKNNMKIRKAETEDSATLCKWWNNGRVMAHAGFPGGLDTDEKKVAELIKQNSEQNRILILEYEDRPIGEMNYRTVQDGIAEIGIKICDSNMQNRGLGTGFLKMLIGYLFNIMKYKKIILDTNLKNTRAQRVYEKLGFNRIRTRIDSWKDHSGNLQSAVDYELTPDLYDPDC